MSSKQLFNYYVRRGFNIPTSTINMSDKLFIVKKRVYAKNIAEAIKYESRGEIEEVWESKEKPENGSTLIGFNAT